MVAIDMAKGTRDLILRDRLQFNTDALGDVALVYGRIDMSDFVNVVKREGFAIKEIRIQLRNPDNSTGVFDPLLIKAGSTEAFLKVFGTTTAYENAADVGIASPDVISVLEMTSTGTRNAAGELHAFQNQQIYFGTPDLHPDGYNVVSDLLIGVSAVSLNFPDTTLELDVMLIGEPVKLTEADMTEMLTQSQDL